MTRKRLPCLLSGAMLASLSLPAAAEEFPRFDLAECQKPAEQLSPEARRNCLAHIRIAEDFADYAVMAADTYRALSRLDWHKMRRLSRQEQQERRSGHAEPEADIRYACPDGNCEAESGLPSGSLPEQAPPGQQELAARAESAEDDWQQDAAQKYGTYTYFPTPLQQLDYAHCTEHSEKAPNGKSKSGISVPIILPDWVRLFDFDRSAPTRSYFSFVPGLFVEVWTRERPPAAGSGKGVQAEYAIVFRGTQGGGGILSDLRFLTTLLPFHDQYDQVRRLYPRLREEIELREAEEDENLKQACQQRSHCPPPREKPLITLVGHSLGAGLAMHVALHHKGIHRIVGFNPSALSGYTSTSYCDRADNLATVQSVHFIYENAEILHHIEPRNNSERIDPALPTTLHFHQINLTGDDIFIQHSIGPMACKLAVIRKEAATLREKLHAARPADDHEILVALPGVRHYSGKKALQPCESREL